MVTPQKQKNKSKWLVEEPEDDEARDDESGAAPAGSLMSVSIHRRSSAARKQAAAKAQPRTATPVDAPVKVQNNTTQRTYTPTAEEQDASAAGAAEGRTEEPRPVRAHPIRAQLASARAGGPERQRDQEAPPQVIRKPEEILNYWSQLRNGRRFPATSDLDTADIAAGWPNSMLIRCRAGSQVMEPEQIFSSANGLGAGGSGSGKDGAFALSPMMLQWLLSLAGGAVRDQRPMEDREAFPARDRAIDYRAIALPLSENQKDIDHVLCHIWQAA